MDNKWPETKFHRVNTTDIYEKRLLLNQNKLGELKTCKTYQKEPNFSITDIYTDYSKAKSQFSDLHYQLKESPLVVLLLFMSF